MSLYLYIPRESPKKSFYCLNGVCIMWSTFQSLICTSRQTWKCYTVIAVLLVVKRWEGIAADKKHRNKAETTCMYVQTGFIRGYREKMLQ